MVWWLCVLRDRPGSTAAARHSPKADSKVDSTSPVGPAPTIATGTSLILEALLLKARTIDAIGSASYSDHCVGMLFEGVT